MDYKCEIQIFGYPRGIFKKHPSYSRWCSQNIYFLDDCKHRPWKYATTLSHLISSI